MAKSMPHTAKDWPRGLCFTGWTWLLFPGGDSKALCSELLHATWPGTEDEDEDFWELTNFVVQMQPSRSSSCIPSPVPALSLTQDEQAPLHNAILILGNP